MKRILLVLFVCLFISGCVEPEPVNLGVKDNILSVNITGYKPDCIEDPNIYLFEDGDWRWANDYLPHMQEYYVDGDYWINRCDLIFCREIEYPVEVELVEYEMVGNSSEWNYEGFPEYESVVLHGKLKVEIGYYADEECDEARNYTVILEN